MLKIKYYYFEKLSLIKKTAYINPRLISSITNGYEKYKQFFYVNIDGETYPVKNKELKRISAYLGHDIKL